MRWSWERAKKELDKCILVCSNCHREIHFKIIDIDLQKNIKPWITSQCKLCSAQFETKITEQKYCSAECAKIGQRKVERPNKEELLKLLNELPMTKIGRMFHVSDNAVRKWAKKYDIL